MTTTVEELTEMLHEAHRMSRGPARYAAYDAVFRHADAAGHIEFGFRARMSTLSELHHHGEYARSLMAFTSCLSTFDAHPEVTRGGDEHTLLWRFKWMVWALTQFSGLPMERAAAVIDDMERRYRAGNHSLHAVHQHRAIFATHLGDLTAAGHWLGEMRTARRDSLSDCAACVPTSEVEFLVATGEFEEAVRVGAPYTGGGCTEQPHQILSQLLLPYLRTGRHALAAEAHRKAYQRIRDNRHYLELIGLHLQFCGLTGNEEHGLKIIERHLSWRERPSSPFAAMEFASGAALVLRRLVDSGRGDLPLRRQTDAGDRRWESTVAETHAELAAAARAEATAFDARNGNAYQSDRVEARLTAEPIVASLPLTVVSGRPIAAHPDKAAVDALVRQIAERTAARDVAGAARLRLRVAHLLRNAARWEDATESAEEAVRSLDRAALPEAAMEARHLLLELYGRTPGHHRETAALLEEMLTAPQMREPGPARAALLERAATIGRRNAVPMLLEAADIHRAAGDPVAESRAVLDALSRITTPPDDWAALVSRVDGLIGAGLVEERALPSVQAELCRLESHGGRREEALARARRHPGDHAELRIREAFLLLELGRHAEAEEVARPWSADEEGGMFWEACVIVVRSLQARDRRDEAVAFLAAHDMDLDDMDDVYVD